MKYTKPQRSLNQVPTLGAEQLACARAGLRLQRQQLGSEALRPAFIGIRWIRAKRPNKHKDPTVQTALSGIP